MQNYACDKKNKKIHKSITAKDTSAALTYLNENFHFAPKDLETCKSMVVFKKKEEIRSWKEACLRVHNHHVLKEKIDS